MSKSKPKPIDLLLQTAAYPLSRRLTSEERTAVRLHAFYRLAAFWRSENLRTRQSGEIAYRSWPGDPVSEAFHWPLNHVEVAVRHAREGYPAVAENLLEAPPPEPADIHRLREVLKGASWLEDATRASGAGLAFAYLELRGSETLQPEELVLLERLLALGRPAVAELLVKLGKGGAAQA